MVQQGTNAMIFLQKPSALLILLIGSLVNASNPYDEISDMPSINNSSGNGNRTDNNHFNNVDNNERDVNELNSYKRQIQRPQIQHEMCQTERFEHPVIMKKYHDSTGYWVIYSQIIETRNVGNQCHRNEYVYLAQRKKAGWFWNPKVVSLVQYSLGEPKFISRRVRHPDRPNVIVLVNMSTLYTPPIVSYDHIFPVRLAGELTAIGSDDTKWSETATVTLPIIKTDTAYFEMILPRENTGAARMKILNENLYKYETLE